MKNRYAVVIYCILPINALAVEVCNTYDVVPVKNEEYIVQNNVWGATTKQCVTIPDTNIPSFTVSKSEHNGTTVAAYPSIFKGCHWGVCSRNSGMPISVDRIGKAKFVWDVTPAAGTFVGNIAAEAWLSPNRDTSSGYEGGAELMIWLDAKGGMIPAGEQVSTVNLASTTWEVWFKASDGQNWNLNYIAYRPSSTSGATSVDLDLNDFIKDAIVCGYIEKHWFLHDLEAGTEIMSGGLGFRTNNFSFSVLPWSEPPAAIIGTPNWGYTLEQLYDEPELLGIPTTWTELDEAPGYFGVMFNELRKISGVRFFSYPQDNYWNHIQSYKVWVQPTQGASWIEIDPIFSTFDMTGGRWEVARFDPILCVAVKVEYLQVSYNSAPRVGELQFLAVTAGDANGDSKINSLDLKATGRQILGITPAGNGDCNEDAVVDARDVVCVAGKMGEID